MEKPSWAPLVLSGAIPRETTDVLAMMIMGLASFEASISTATLPVLGRVQWFLLLTVALACSLASLSDTTKRLREELAVFAYGGATWHIALRYFLRGFTCTLIGLSPYLVIETSFPGSSLKLEALALALFATAGGAFYSLPSFGRTRSLGFVEQYKG